MRKDIHPEYHSIDVKLTDGTIVKMRSTWGCLLYTSDAADEQRGVDLGGRRIIKKKKKQRKKKKTKYNTHQQSLDDE